MKILYFLGLAAMLSWSLSCDSGKTPPSAEHSENPEASVDNLHEEGDMYLDEGKKWRVDSGMLVYLRTMEAAISSFAGTDMLAYDALSETLQRESDLLTSNCTMKGEAHDVLHVWLVPYLDLVEALSDAQTPEERSAHHVQLRDAFARFNEYFE